MQGVTRLALHVVQGADLADASAAPPDTFAVVAVHTKQGTKAFQTRSRTIQRSAAPRWQLSCVVDLTQDAPLEAAVVIDVRKPARVGAARLVCAYEGTIQDLLLAGARARLPVDSAPEAVRCRGACHKCTDHDSVPPVEHHEFAALVGALHSQLENGNVFKSEHEKCQSSCQPCLESCLHRTSLCAGAE